MGPTLNCPSREGGRFTELGYGYNGIVWVILWDPNKTIDIGEWSICGAGRLERFYCIHINVYNTCMHTHIHTKHIHLYTRVPCTPLHLHTYIHA